MYAARRCLQVCCSLPPRFQQGTGKARTAKRQAPQREGKRDEGAGQKDEQRRPPAEADPGSQALQAAASKVKAARVVLQKGKSRLFWGAAGSPIAFGGAVDRIVGAQPKNGDAVLLCDHNDNPLGWGAVNLDSMYRVRVLQTAAEAAAASGRGAEVTLSFADIVAARLAAAAATRRRIGLPTPGRTTGYRLVNSEGDRLSGLVVDVFGDYAVAAVTAAWAEQNKVVIAAAVLRVTGAKAVLWRANADYLRLEGMQGTFPPTIVTPDGKETQLKLPGWSSDEPAAAGEGGHSDPAAEAAARSGGEPASVSGGSLLPDPYEVLEDGVRYLASLSKGQKTGFYFDQRENRARVRKWAPGARVLDLCCYSGGFAVNAALGGAASVTAVDSSASALRLAAANAKLNGVEGVCSFVEADVLTFLQNAVAEGQGNTYDIVILDPPKLAPTRDSLPRAKGHYRRLNELAARLVKSGGMLVTCTCSGAMTQSGEFAALAMDAVSGAGKSAALLATSGAAPDHAIHPGYPEGNYLTCAFIGIQ